MKSCPICGLELKDLEIENHIFKVYCNRCGHYDVDKAVCGMLESKVLKSKFIKAVVSHKIRKRELITEQVPLITLDWLHSVISNAELPKPHEQAKNLVLWFGYTFQNFLGYW